MPRLRKVVSVDAPDPLAHVPDPDQRYQVFGVTRGAVMFIQIFDAETKTGLVLDLLTALDVASQINREAVRVLEDVGRQEDALLDPETLDKNDPRWQDELWKRDRLS